MKKIKKIEILNLDLSDYQEVGPAPVFLTPIEIIVLQLSDILDDCGYSDVMCESWGKEYYFYFQDDLYSFIVIDSGCSDESQYGNYGEISDLNKVVEYEIIEE
jgi:hypothetical protein